MTTLIAYNARAGNFSKLRFDRFLGAMTRGGQRCIPIDSHAPDIAEQAQAAKHICVYGGDGTLRDVIERIGDVPDSKTVSIFPAGTINLVAREAGYPSREKMFAAYILAPSARRKYYSAAVNGTRFMACASVGPDSFAVARLSPRLKKWIGRYAYAAAFLQQMLFWQRPLLRITADGAVHEGEAVYILKGRYFAGPWQLDDKADLASAHLAVLILPQAKRRDFLRLILSALVWKGFAPTCIRLTCRTVEIASEAQLPLQADGDIITHTPARVDLSARPLTFL